MPSIDVDTNRTAREWPALLAWGALVFVTAAAGTVASLEAASFYSALKRPEWAPPSSWFGPVWTVLYIAMAVAAWLVWRERLRTNTSAALALFVIQLALNALWSWLFFAWRQGAMAFADIVLLCVLVAATIAAFWRVRPVAGALLLPYLLWVSFATALSFAVWRANPGLLG
ncbi:MAG TPA: TspO/MBR family protein [Longimicrobium sp.]|nr:TspO/MBR family protein [Longimicrobium sp.]